MYMCMVNVGYRRIYFPPYNVSPHIDKKEPAAN